MSVSRKRQKHRHREQGDSDLELSYSDSYSQDCKRKRSTDISIPCDTHLWSEFTLRRLNIKWDSKVMKSPGAVLDFVKQIPPLDDDLKMIAEYIKKNIVFDDIVLSPENKNLPYCTNIFSSLSLLQKKLDEALGKPGQGKYQYLVNAHGIDFLEEVKTLTYNYCYDKENYQTAFTSILQTFCRMTNLVGRQGVVKRTRKVLNVDATTIPDIVFQIYTSPTVLLQLSTLCVTEVKKKHLEYGATHKTKPVTQSKSTERKSSDKDTNKPEISKTHVEEKLIPQEIKGSSHHVGQLLLEMSHSVVPDYSIGLLFSGSKAMLTCLQLSTDYTLHLPSKLEDDDYGTIYFSDMYDILVTKQRHQLVEALLRLGYYQKNLCQYT